MRKLLLQSNEEHEGGDGHIYKDKFEDKDGSKYEDEDKDQVGNKGEGKGDCVRVSLRVLTVSS